VARCVHSCNLDYAWFVGGSYTILTTGRLQNDTLETPKKPAARVAGSLAGQGRRVCPRYPFTATAETLDANSCSRISARTTDRSIGGCYVDTFCLLPRETDVKIRISRDGEFLDVQAMVVYSKIGMGMGLCFSSLEPDQRAMLNRWIAELSGDAPLSFGQHRAEEPAAETTVERAESRKE
jgi:hypothetical protein